MSNSRIPSDIPNAPHDNNAPPTQQPPQYSEQSAIELRDNTYEGASQSVAELEASTLSPQTTATTTTTTTAATTTKPEASAYAGSYRPSDAQAHISATPNTHHDLDASQVDEHAATHSDLPPPAYTELPGQISSENSELGTNAIVADDGRVNIRIDQKSRSLTQLIVPQLQRQLTRVQQEPAPPPPYIPEFLGGAPGQDPPPPLNIVIQVVGSRGDVQPFVALGKVLKETYNHRVRLATHPTFKDFVVENGLEFFSIGGDPAELMAFMVKNPGLMPGFDTMRSGDIGKRRKGIAEILRGTWRSCIETGNGLGVDPLHQTVEEWMGIEEQLPEQLKKPFVADAIIANPPAFGHIHCAEKLGIPLHMMFTMPWSPTQQFPHPLANIQSSNADATITNYISYLMVDLLTWQGLGDVINKFRKESLHLDPVSIIWGPAMLARLRVPFTYCWSPALIPKPKDWGNNISIAGFYFLNLAQNYTPEPELAAFLDAGEPPVYIGFGSIVVDDPNAMTTMIFEAVKKTGKRALVSKGWGGLGADELGIPEGVFMLGNCPHDWLFKRVSAVVHHGGAGTTAAGIAAGRPTVVVPFFGDQPFWGAMVARAGAGPDPIPYKELTPEKLAGAITEALLPESLNRAQELCDKIKQEEGCQVGAQAFHQMLKYDDLRCAVTPSLPAVWRVKRTQTRLSTRAATVLAQEGELDFSDLKLYRSREYEIDGGPIDPFSGAASALMGTATSIMMGVADMPIQTLKLLNIHPDAASSRKGKAKATENGSDLIGEPIQPKASRTSTSTSRSSLVSGDSTPTAAQSPGLPGQLHRSSSDLTEPTSPGTPGSSAHRSTFMSQAMAASSGRSRSASRDRARKLTSGGCEVIERISHHKRGSSMSRTEARTDSSSTSGFSANMKSPFESGNSEAVIDTGKGLARIVGAGFKSPMDFSLNIAQGFHNVPKLYGADVRPTDKVTDFQSGIRAAAKGFGFGLYDGITGLVTDPYKGAKKEGGIGFVKGVGRGIFSVPFRVMGGAWGVPGYAMKGLYQEMIKSKGKTITNYIIAARIAQGYDEALSVSDAERAAIVDKWKYVKVGMKKKKNPGEEQLDSLHSLVVDKRKRRHDRWHRVNSQFQRPEARPTQPPATVEYASSQSSTTIPAWRQAELGLQPNSSRSSSLTPQHAATFPLTANAQSEQSRLHLEGQLIAEEEAERREIEAAIAASVADSSRGIPEEDQLIAQAIRASIAELENVPVDAGPNDEEEALKRAMQSSIEEAKRSGRSEEEQKILEETLRKSILDTSRRRQHGSDSEWESSDEDDADFQRILAESKELAHLHQGFPPEYQAAIAAQQSGTLGTQLQSDAGAQQNGILGKTHDHPESNTEENAELKRVLEESERTEKDRMENLHKQMTEEDIVMEYVKKQSVLEEEHRQRLIQGRETAGESSSAGAVL